MPGTNAAIWFHRDGYDPAGQGINGRRVAGESFLRGFFAHAKVDEFVSLAHSANDHRAFAEMARAAGAVQPVRAVRLDTPDRINPVEVVSYPGPLDPIECWRRAPHGGAAWALCGVTHTMSTRTVMRAIFDLRSAPQMPWDALVCTSAAVQATVRRLMELGEAHLADRFPGGLLPARPLMPVIPLGVHCDDHAPDPAAGQALRARLGIVPGDVVAVTIARLTPDEKFDPLPLFLALQAAASQLPDRRLHLVLCGQFRDPHWEGVFARAAAALMPGCGYHLLDGGDPALRRATLSGGDLFVFPIDNVQETFGLAPVEAMAAGLPVIASDWDGLRETVTPEVGILIPTEMPGQGLATYLAQRHLGGTDGYLQYVGQLAALTRLDLGALTAALVALARAPGLRARMGAAGQARARALYDWRAIIPQLQALWGEQAALLAHARKRDPVRPMPGLAPIPPALVPTGPAPAQIFAAYPSHHPDPARTLRPVPLAGRPDLAETLALRDYAHGRRLIEEPDRIAAILAAHAGGATLAAAAAATRLPTATVARARLWLLKYHFLEDDSP
jgi:glycosyltransferase involved in cell wall biosynthesis